MTTSLYFDRLSTKLPIKGDNTKDGKSEINETKPSKKTDSVNRYTNQLIAIRCIHVPNSEIDCPMVCNLKLGY